MPQQCFAKNPKKDSDDSWFFPVAVSAVGGALIGGAIAAWCKDSEINDLDYRPLTTLQELNAKAHRIYGNFLDNTCDSVGHFYDLNYLKKSIRKELPYETFISQLEQLEQEIRIARKQLKNQIKYWDARLHEAYTEARQVLAHSKVTYKKLRGLRRLAQEMLPVLQLEQALYDIRHDSFLRYRELADAFVNMYQAAFYRNNEERFTYFIIELAHRRTDGKELCYRFALIVYAQRLERYIHELEKAVLAHKNQSGAHFDASLQHQAKEILQKLEVAHALLTQSSSYKNELLYKKEQEHKQRVIGELEEQSRLARKQLEYEREQFRIAREQRDAQLRTEQQIALLRLENMVRDLFN